VGKETKFGLLVGVVFIVLFGVILGGRVGSAASEHAPLPVGDSMDHRRGVESILGRGDPLAPGQGSLDIGDFSDGQVTPVLSGPEMQSLPGPENLEADEVEEAEDESVGRLAFGPVTIETPEAGTPGAGTPAPHPGGAVATAHAPDDTGPAPAADDPAAPVPSRPVHVVNKGETLTAIAKQHYGPERGSLWRRIWEANKDRLANPDRLDAGQKLVIPGLPTEAAPPARRVADAGATDEDVRSEGLDELAKRFRVELDDGEVVREASLATYTVKKGDTFYSIAEEVYGNASRVKELVRANRDRVPDARRLRIGQQIVLPESGSSAAAPAETVRQVAQR